MDRILQADNLDKYKSYIQKRRVAPVSSENESSSADDGKKLPTLPELPYKVKEEFSDHSETSFSESYTNSNGFFTDSSRTSGLLDEADDNIKPRNESSDSSYTRSYSSIPRRTDPDLYRRLQSRRTASGLSYSGAYCGGTYSAELEDNRTTVLAVKIIKQCLVCFVLLGIIVLMQQKSEMSGVLDFIKTKVVEDSIDTESLLSGIKNIVTECSRFLGGSP